MNGDTHEPLHGECSEHGAKRTVLSVLSVRQDSLEALPPRARAFALEREIDKRVHPTKREKLPLRHFFANGVCVREISIPAGTVWVGAIHKYDHIWIMIQGDMSVYDETGLHRVAAPATFISRAGIKRAGYVHEDAIFSTVHRPSDSGQRDLLALHKEFYAVTEDEFRAVEKSTETEPSLIVEDAPDPIREH